MIDLRQLEALCAVSDAGSVVGAARALRSSQPTVNYHLKNLEREVGAPLLIRSTRGSTLTHVGSLLLERGSEILTLADRALQDTRELAEVGRMRVRFGIFPTAAASVLPHIVAHMRDLGIEISAELAETTTLIEQINVGALDAALVFTVPGHELPLPAAFETVEVHRDPLLLAIPSTHPLATSGPISTEAMLALHREPWILGATGRDAIDELIIDTFETAHLDIDVTLRTDDYQATLGLVAAGMAVAIVPALAVGGAHEGVTLRPVADPSFTRTILLATPAAESRTERATAVRHLANAIRSAAASPD